MGFIPQYARSGWREGTFKGITGIIDTIARGMA